MKRLRNALARVPEALTGKWSYLLGALVIVVVDQWSKWLVEAHLPGRPPVEVIPNLLNLTYVRNTGVAFGLFPAGGSLGGMLFLSLLGFAGFSLLAYYFLRTPVEHRLLLCSLGLVLGGAIGNLADRIASGAVTDFVDLYFRSYHWYTFNVADSAITVGILLMTVELFLPSGEPSREEPGAPESQSPGESGTAPEPS